ncbi:hypothetical protein B9G69_017315 [Bdellovibrio sp. SKB1291214]|uniref:hypothetical protein n=1 Tax=Bdellovibrio sp. SKB1291214 TaxID=1732569 RepID=UPI00223FE5BB|nr:hypothetical protein [Bdellovibrio sp. SKB1291214]UYL08805.1 hypothetical protein B9G69_017315 [Bdellovibrio sp. SKB1291214]
MTTSCGTENVLSEVSNKETDEAYYIDAKKNLDNMEWDSTASIITTKMSANYQARRDVKMMLASAYAGKCGLIFIDLIQGMTNNTATEMFKYFMGIWGGKTVDPDSCELAIGVLQGIGTAAQRTTNENLFLALLGVARMGTNLSAKLDAVDKNGAIDGVATVCHQDGSGSLTKWGSPYDMKFPAPPPGKTAYMSSTDIKRVASGLGLILENIASLTDALGGGTTIGAIGDLSESCDDALSAVSGASTTCATMTTPAAVSDEMVYAMRFMMDSTEFGFGTCSITNSITFISNIGSFDPVTDSVPADLCCPSTAIPGAP